MKRTTGPQAFLPALLQGVIALAHRCRRWVRGGIDQLFRHSWWVASALTALLIFAPVSLVHRLDMLAYDALAGDLMGSPWFARWQLDPGVYSRPGPSGFGAIPAWVVPPDHQRPGTQGAAVIVAIDDASLQAYGQWPWPRSRHAELIEVLREAGASTIAYDVQFSEVSGRGALSSGDAALVAAVAAHGRVVLPVYPQIQSEATGEPPALQGPLPELRRVAAALGHAALALDEDGASRRALLDLQIDGRPVPSMPVALWSLERSAQTARQLGPTLATRPAGPFQAADDALINQQGGARIFPVREALLPAGGQRVPQLSAARVLMDPSARVDLRGRAIWVGVSATGLSEPLSTPAARPEPQWSRLRWQAQVYEALRHQQLIQPLDQALVASAVLPPLLLMALVASRRRDNTRGRWGMALIGLPGLSTLLLLVFASAWLPPVAATIGWSVGYGLWRGRHLRQQREALDRWQQRADATLHAIADAVITVDSLGRIEYVNPVTSRWLQTPARHLHGRSLKHLPALNADSREGLDRIVWDCIDSRAVIRATRPLRLLTLEGARHIEATATPVFASNHPEPPHQTSAEAQRVVGAVLVLNDVTEQRQSERRLRHEATHDALTGLYNRAGLTEQLQQALDDRVLAREGVGVLFIDLDRFKRINDSLGHHHGDTVLRTVAHRLSSACGPRDTAARWGGDEFVVLTTDCENLAQRAQGLVDVVSQDLRVDGIDVQCGCSIGIAMAPKDGTTLEGLLAQADLAMYRSKAGGGRRYAFTDHEPRAWTRESLNLETRLRRSLGDGTLALHYQPQVQMSSGDTVGMEALLRWHQPDGSIWTPPSFLAVAESSDVILPLGEWVINQAVQQVALWMAQGMPVVPVSVNVSARQCLDLHLVDLMRSCLALHRVPSSLVKVEVTETTAMADLEHVSKLLQDLRTLGVAVAVDDFGTGYSSLAHLRRLPVDQLKIDQSFVRQIANDRYDAAVVRAMISLAHELGVPVVAEGVESESQMHFLSLHDCDIAQGYYYAQPLDSPSATRYLQLHHPRNRPSSEQRGLALH